METENKDWKPEVGDVVWRFLRGDGMRLKAFRIKSFNRFADGDKYALLEMDDTQWPIQLDSIFPTPEAALTSIRVYDLEGKEVLIPHAAPDFSLDEMVDFFNKWIKIDGNMKLFLEAQGKPVFSSTIGKYMDRAKEIVDSEVQALAFRFMLTDEAGHQNYTWEECLEMARREIEGRGANSGKSDQREC